MELAGWRVYLFGMFLLIALLMFFFVMYKRGRELYFDEEALMDEVFVSLFYGILGGRILYVLTHWDRFNNALFGVFNVFGKPGIYYPGLLLGGVIAFAIHGRKRKWDVYVAADILANGWVLLYALSSLAMFVGGVGYGVATESIIGMSFPGVYDKRIPVQLFESIAYMGVFIWLWKLEDVYRTFAWYKANKSEAASGFIFALFLIIHGFLGVIFVQLKPVSLALYGVRIETLLFLALMIFGTIILHRRSGKGLVYLFEYIIKKVTNG